MDTEKKVQFVALTKEEIDAMIQQAALAAAVPPAQTHAFSLPDLCAEGRTDHASLIAWRDIVQPHQHIAVMAERADLQLIHPLHLAKQGTLFGNGRFTARRDGFRALHHLGGLLEALQQRVDLRDRHTRTVGDAGATRAVDELRIPSLGRGHRTDEP